MLQTLAQRYPTALTRAQLGTLAGFTPSGGTFGTYFGTLKRQGLLVEASHGDVEITQVGLQYLGSEAPPAPQITAELLAMWQRALRQGEWRMLEALVQGYPKGLTRDELGERTGYTTSGGTFGTYLGTLWRNGLIEMDGDQIRASATLLFEGRPPRHGRSAPRTARCAFDACYEFPQAGQHVLHQRKGYPMSKIVYVQRPEGIEPPQHVWVREPSQAVPSPDEPADYRLEATQPHYPLTTEAEVRAWIQSMFHAGTQDVLTDIRFLESA